MKRFNKKMLAGVMAGVMMLGGSALLFDTAQAAEQANGVKTESPQNMPPRFNLNTAAERLAADCKVDAMQVLNYCNNGGNFHEACYAAHIAKLGGKSFDEVVQAKTADNSWEQVAEAMGVTQEMLRDDRCAFMAADIAQRGNVAEADAMKLLQEGYKPHDIEAAGILAKAASKDISEVITMKKVNNSWFNVADELGVDKAALNYAPFLGQRNFGRHHNRPDGGCYHNGQGYGPGNGRGNGQGYGPGDCPVPDCPRQ